MNTIAIDCGASFIKAAKIQNGRVICEMQVKSPVVSEDAIQRSCQIEQLVKQVINILKEMTSVEKEVALGISNEMHGFILAYEDGTAFTDYISWQKEYGGIRLESLDSATPQEFLERSISKERICNTGMPLRAGLPSCNLLYLHQIGRLEQAEKPLYFCTLGDFILWRISGKRPMTHPTNAAATGMYDLKSNKWDEDMISCCCDAKIVFPLVGTECLDFCFGAMRIHAFPAIGDQQAALLGAGLDDMQTVSFNLGTGAQVSMLTDRFKAEESVQIRPYFYGKYLRTIPHIPSGRALNVFIRFIQNLFAEFRVNIEEEKLWETILRLEKKVENTNLQCDLSFFQNAITSCTTGSISRIGETNLLIENLFHAIFMQMATNYLYCADRLSTSGRNIQKILFSGGIARKIPRIRETILAHYPPEILVTVAENETLIGIDHYLRSSSES